MDHATNKSKKDREKGEQLITKLIKKRKQENDAFIKLLTAIENSKSKPFESKRAKGKIK